MLTNSKSLVILTLFSVLWLENKAHHCGCPHKKTHKRCKEETTSTATSTSMSTPELTPIPTPTSTTATATQIKVNSKCNTGTEPSCECGIESDTSLYYPVPKSGNCNDVFKRLSTTKHLSDYHFREENCSLVQRTVCGVYTTCDDYFEDRLGTPPPTPYEFISAQNASEPFCLCGYGGGGDHYPIPKSGNCTELEIKYNFLGAGYGCYKAQTLCRDNCYCNSYYVDPTKCDPKTCNNATKPFCKCGIEDSDNNYPVPKSGNCMDYLSNNSTTPIYYYRFGAGCYKLRTVCECTKLHESQAAQCLCDDESAD